MIFCCSQSAKVLIFPTMGTLPPTLKIYSIHSKSILRKVRAEVWMGVALRWSMTISLQSFHGILLQSSKMLLIIFLSVSYLKQIMSMIDYQHHHPDIWIDWDRDRANILDLWTLHPIISQSCPSHTFSHLLEHLRKYSIEGIVLSRVLNLWKCENTRFLRNFWVGVKSPKLDISAMWVLNRSGGWVGSAV